MVKEALATKYRPKTFQDVVEQSSQVKILEHQIKTETFKNCYLFSGRSGSGKTTVARIMANEINKGIGDPIELDAAKNNGVDDVRQMIEDASLKSLSGKYKVFIVDECHMFSQGAWNAMLKLLEEPPLLTIFILCTTDPQKVPITILNRVQRFDFKAISHKGIADRLRYIIKSESSIISSEMENAGNYIDSSDVFSIDDSVYDYIAKLADGGMRDAISMLDKCLSFSSNLTIDIVTQALGLSKYENIFDLVDAIEGGQTKKALEIIKEISSNGTDLKQFLKQFYMFLVDANKYIILEDISETKIPSIYEDRLRNLDKDVYIHLMKEFMGIYEKFKWETDIKELLTAKIIVLCME